MVVLVKHPVYFPWCFWSAREGIVALGALLNARLEWGNAPQSEKSSEIPDFLTAVTQLSDCLRSLLFTHLLWKVIFDRPKRDSQPSSMY